MHVQKATDLGPTALVIAPASVIDNWAREFDTWTYLSVGVYRPANEKDHRVLKHFRRGRFDVGEHVAYQQLFRIARVIIRSHSYLWYRCGSESYRGSHGSGLLLCDVCFDSADVFRSKLKGTTPSSAAWMRCIGSKITCPVPAWPYINLHVEEDLVSPGLPCRIGTQSFIQSLTGAFPANWAREVSGKTMLKRH